MKRMIWLAIIFLLLIGVKVSWAQPWGAISGQVIDEETEEPIHGVRVYAVVMPHRHFRFATTNHNGEYLITQIPPSDSVRAYVAMRRHSNGPFEIIKWYDNKRDFLEADLIPVFEGEITENINFAVIRPHPNALITGRVVDEENGEPINHPIDVLLFAPDRPQHPIITQHVTPEGHFRLPVFPGDYVLYTVPHRGGDYLPEYFNNKRSFFNADVINMSEGDSVRLHIGLVYAEEPLHFITGQVLDEENLPAPETTVSAVSARMVYSSEEWDYIETGKTSLASILTPNDWATTITDENGDYRLPIFEEQEYFIMVFPPQSPAILVGNTINWQESESLLIEESIEDVDFSTTLLDTSEATSSIAGYIDYEGDPMDRVRVYAVNPVDYHVVAFTLTERGRYHLTDLLPHTDYLIMTNRLGYYHAVYPETITTGAVYEVRDSINFSLIRYEASSTPDPQPTIQIPSHLQLYQNMPNPFNPQTIIPYQLEKQHDVTISIYDIHGRLIQQWLYPQQAAGYYTIHWDGTDAEEQSAASGVYIYRLKAGHQSESKTMILLR